MFTPTAEKRALAGTAHSSEMLTPPEAERIISENLPLLPSEDRPLGDALGRTLRAPVTADRDLPPFDRVTMDGYAVRSTALAAGCQTFQVIGFQAAGMIPLRIDQEDGAVEIATGAVLPTGADCVIPYEDAQREGTTNRMTTTALVSSGANVHRRASDHVAGTPLISAGARLSGREIAVAAACGAATLRVSVIPRIAVVATGDELVEVDAVSLAPHQIRRSNDRALQAGLEAAGYTRVERFHVRDVRPEIVTALQRIISEFDVLILTGGISKGKFDYLPGVLSQLGVDKKLQGVAQRPGKPFWFGITSKNTPVFALPGNPVSTYTCFCRYVLPALQQMSGSLTGELEYAALDGAIGLNPKLSHLLPVKVQSAPDGRRLAAVRATNTSGDLAGLLGTTGFLELPAGKGAFPDGTVARYWPWR